jgi:N-acetylglucosamine kinase-like BadF-type ATPase
VLVDEHGAVLASAYGSASNPLRTGYAKTWFALSSTADAVLARQKIKSTDIAGICAGLGGAARTQVARRIASFLERSFPNAAVQVTSDMDIALAAAAGEGRGIVLIAGTGSVAFGRTGFRRHGARRRVRAVDRRRRQRIRDWQARRRGGFARG